MKEYVLVYLKPVKELISPGENLNYRVRTNIPVLLILKEKPGQKGRLNLVGGKVEEGETPEKAAHRELKEEAGWLAADMKKQKKLNGIHGMMRKMTIA